MTCQSRTVTASIEQLPLSQALLRHKSTLSSALNIITQKLGHEMECSCLWLGQVNAAKRWAWEMIPTVLKKQHTHAHYTETILIHSSYNWIQIESVFLARILIQNVPASLVYNKSPPRCSFETDHTHVGSPETCVCVFFLLLHEIETDLDFLTLSPCS